MKTPPTYLTAVVTKPAYQIRATLWDWVQSLELEGCDAELVAIYEILTSNGFHDLDSLVGLQSSEARLDLANRIADALADVAI